MFRPAPSRPSAAPAGTSLPSPQRYRGILFEEGSVMTWFIGRAEALSNPEAARRKALERIRGLTALDDPESLVVPILLDAILMAEAYRGARHQVSFLPELTKNVDELLRELTIVEKTQEWAGS
jgi:hypothetical protein